MMVSRLYKSCKNVKCTKQILHSKHRSDLFIFICKEVTLIHLKFITLLINKKKKILKHLFILNSLLSLFKKKKNLNQLSSTMDS